MHLDGGALVSCLQVGLPELGLLLALPDEARLPDLCIFEMLSDACGFKLPSLGLNPRFSLPNSFLVAVLLLGPIR
jgi:hypothetical protein